MKGFLLEPKEGVGIESVMKRLEEVVGKGHIIFYEGDGVLSNKFVAFRDGPMDTVKLYYATIYFPKKGIVAIISDPAYYKLAGQSTKKVIPKTLNKYLKTFTECKIESVMTGSQG